MTVSLIITTYNWPQALELVLKSVMEQSIVPNEIVIADDGSGPGTAELIQRIAKECIVPVYHAWQEDEGFRAASVRNKAIRQANSDYLVLIDGDMILHPKFMEDHLKQAKSNTFIQGSRVLLTEHRTQEVLLHKVYRFSFFSQGLQNRKNAIHSNILSKIFSQRRSTLKGIKTCNFSLYKEDAYKVNGFNEAFIGWGREDSEFAARLMNAGIERKDVRFNAIAYHLYHRENTRVSLPLNDQILEDTIVLKEKWCAKGLV
ncbi:family 2 glycosyl transferase [Sulfurovum lithotrophicum]|uniref:Family 2 glycosyl transferase n=1 Tax=Sulfurovum lithotrophicum TaxID=206403 RepID=A0A7U4M024_9BACT|nr:glycosyltransferase family 2 protein [Sulfurovum lithotrophicum]AKF24346.1 family 2 glycosyl transferase [Sulfurovum lithotrophicum]